jgi:hypothetical protein
VTRTLYSGFVNSGYEPQRSSGKLRSMAFRCSASTPSPTEKKTMRMRYGLSRNRSLIASNLRRKISGTPGNTWTFSTTTTGTIRWSEARSWAPSGISAILSRASLIRDWYTSSSAVTRPGSFTTRRPKARATPSIVTSSWVGPTPPDVNTQS